MQVLRNIWLEGSIARAILIAMLVVSIVPIVLISVLFVNQSSESLTKQMETNVELLATTRAGEMNLALTDVENTTRIAAQQAAMVLTRAENTTLSDFTTEQVARYQTDSRNILGLDEWYNTNNRQDRIGSALSNVYWNNANPVGPHVMREILLSEELDTTFGSIKDVSPNTQWVYMTTTDGLMRLYPWASNNHYPDNWDPREIVFYTVAEPGVNPELEPRWTAPYVDFAGAGWMVTLSVPIVDKTNTFQGVMSQDITINQIQAAALGTNVLGGAGYGFLVDDQGNVVAHPDFQDDDAHKGSQEVPNLLDTGPVELRPFVRQMIQGESGLGYFNDGERGEQLLVYAPISSIGWSLGIVVPRTEVIAPAQTMQNRALAATAALMVLATIFAIFLTRFIHKPLLQLLQGVLQVAEDKEADTLSLNSFTELNRLADAFNEMTAKVWERQTKLKREVADLRIEVDSVRQKAQIDSIVDSDYFKHLEMNAERMRSKLRGVDSSV